MSKTSDNSYKSILKGTSIFGGVQIFQILINLVRTKYVALLLGTEGMGISALFTSSSNTIQRFSSLGLNLAIVREMAEKSNDEDSVSKVIRLSLKLLIATSLLGAIICICFAFPLSKLTFGDSSMGWQFMLLGIAVALGIASTGIMSMLQGLHQVKRLSKASIVGGLTGLLVGVPLYYWFGTKGIVPAMIALSLSMFLFYFISLRKTVEIKPSQFSFEEQKPIVRRLIGMGVILMSNDIIVTAITYVINLVIRTLGSVDEVGLYQAANSATAQYSGLVFTAMAMDYFPRLTKASSDNRLMHGIVNRQTEIVSLIIAPAATLLILTAPLVIKILFTSQFTPILPLMRWMGLGIAIRAITFPMAYITFAKGNKRVFFILEGIVCNTLTLTLSCLGYYLFGLIGLGYALVADNALCLIIYYLVNHSLYGYTFTRASILSMLGAIVITIACFTSAFIQDTTISYALMATVCSASAILSVIYLRRRLKS